MRTAVHSIQPTDSTATAGQNHNNSPDVLGRLSPGVRAKAKRIGDDFSMKSPREQGWKFVLSIT